ncbi:MAG: hypothetical protein L3J39_14360 [Verrucomicrobiales bacterium]|nr:hypothetical protein [Verrucomicrobiales bacterium]
MILSTTAMKNGGLCGPCSIGEQYITIPDIWKREKLKKEVEKLNLEAAIQSGYDPKTSSHDSAGAYRKPSNAPKSWKHPNLGKFKLDSSEEYWTTRIQVPALVAFTLDDPHLDKKTDDLYEIRIGYDPERDTPSDDMIAVAIKILDHQTNLLTKITQAIWDDFSGHGPESGMWWHNDLNEVKSQYEYMDDNPPETANDLFRRMSAEAIHIHKQVEGYDGAVAELEFRADYEEEHGLGVLTDGDVILGIGYAGDTMVFGFL